MKTAEQVHQETRADLEGRNGAQAREQTLRGLVRMQTRQMVDQMTVFGTNGARVMNTRGSILITPR